MDAVLQPFLAATEGDADEALGRLLSGHASPIVRRVVTGRLRGSNADVEDVCSQVLLQLMLRLRQGRRDEDLHTIGAFDGYIATAAHHGCDHYLRRRYPLRWQLRNRVRYVLEHDPIWAVWKSHDGTWLCGRADWQSRTTGEAPDGTELGDVGPEQVRELLVRIFPPHGRPLPLWIVVDLAAQVWGVPLRPQVDDKAVDTVVDKRSAIDADMALRARTARVWSEVRELPVRQRQALLLNLKDDGLTLFLSTGTASFRAIAEALEMTAEALAALWNELPLPDQEVAVRLGCTRQQVINFRMSARKRLSNRLAAWS